MEDNNSKLIGSIDIKTDTKKIYNRHLSGSLSLKDPKSKSTSGTTNNTTGSTTGSTTGGNSSESTSSGTQTQVQVRPLTEAEKKQIEKKYKEAYDKALKDYEEKEKKFKEAIAKEGEQRVNELKTNSNVINQANQQAENEINKQFEQDYLDRYKATHQNLTEEQCIIDVKKELSELNENEYNTQRNYFLASQKFDNDNYNQAYAQYKNDHPDATEEECENAAQKALDELRNQDDYEILAGAGQNKIAQDILDKRSAELTGDIAQSIWDSRVSSVLSNNQYQIQYGDASDVIGQLNENLEEYVASQVAYANYKTELENKIVAENIARTQSALSGIAEYNESLKAYYNGNGTSAFDKILDKFYEFDTDGATTSQSLVKYDIIDGIGDNGVHSEESKSRVSDDALSSNKTDIYYSDPNSNAQKMTLDSLFANKDGYGYQKIMPINTEGRLLGASAQTQGFYTSPADNVLNFGIPQWGYLDFINERSMFQKGISSLFNDPAYFYFKIFFDFSNPYGLFGNIHRSAREFRKFGNSAIKYLYYLDSSKRYGLEYIADRIVALKKFASILQYICANAPWFFSGISGLQEADGIHMQDLSKTRTVTIECNPDAIDMRLSTMLDLYRFACYDTIEQKEIIPDNLRKFDMTIILFQTPLKYLHTGIHMKNTDSSGSQYIDYKTFGSRSGIANVTNVESSIDTSNNTQSNNQKTSSKISSYASTAFDNAMSYKMYTFMGCEISPETFNGVSPSNAKNDQPFQFQNISIKISYDKCYTHTMNEYFHMMFGVDGFHALNTVKKSDFTIKNRLSALQDAVESNDFSRIVDASEYVMHGLNTLTSNKTNYNKEMTYKDAFIDTNNAPLGSLYGDIGLGSYNFKEKLNKLLDKNGTEWVHPQVTIDASNSSDLARAHTQFLPDDKMKIMRGYVDDGSPLSLGNTVKSITKEEKEKEWKTGSPGLSAKTLPGQPIYDGGAGLDYNTTYWVKTISSVGDGRFNNYMRQSDIDELHQLKNGTLNQITMDGLIYRTKTYNTKYQVNTGNIKSTEEKIQTTKKGETVNPSYLYNTNDGNPPVWWIYHSSILGTNIKITEYERQKIKDIKNGNLKNINDTNLELNTRGNQNRINVDDQILNLRKTKNINNPNSSETRTPVKRQSLTQVLFRKKKE